MVHPSCIFVTLQTVAPLAVLFLSNVDAFGANVGFLVGDAFFSGELLPQNQKKLAEDFDSGVETTEIQLRFERNVIRCSLPSGVIDMGGFIGAGGLRVHGLSRKDCELLLQLPDICFGQDKVPGYRALVYNSDFDSQKYHFFCLYNEKWRPDVISEGERESAVQKLFRPTIRYEAFIADHWVAAEDVSNAEYVNGLEIDPPVKEELIAMHTHSGGPWKVRVAIPVSKVQILFCARGDELKIWRRDEEVRFYIFRSGSLQKVKFLEGKLHVVSEITGVEDE